MVKIMSVIFLTQSGVVKLFNSQCSKFFLVVATK